MEGYNDTITNGDIMRSIFVIIIIFFLLTACSQNPDSTAATPTAISAATHLPTETLIPSITPPPLPTLIPTLTADRILQPLKYSPEDLAQYTSIENKTVIVGGTEYTGVVGINTDGSEHTLALEINGVMTRVGEAEYFPGIKSLIYVTPEFDPLHRINVTDKAPVIVMDAFMEALAKGEFKYQVDADPEKMKALIAADLAKPVGERTFTFQIPVADPGKNDWAVKWVEPQVRPDFSKPIELKVILGRDDAKEFMKTEMGDIMMDYRYDEFESGVLVFVAADGHIQVIGVEGDETGQTAYAMIPTDLKWKKFIEDVILQKAGNKKLGTIAVLGKHGDSEAFNSTFRYGTMSYTSTAKGMFEIEVEMPQ